MFRKKVGIYAVIMFGALACSKKDEAQKVSERSGKIPETAARLAVVDSISHLNSGFWLLRGLQPVAGGYYFFRDTTDYQNGRSGTSLIWMSLPVIRCGACKRICCRLLPGRTAALPVR